MKPVLVPAAIAAAGVAVVLFVSLTLSNVLGVITMMGRFPESMVDYILPVLETTVPERAVSIAVFGIGVFCASVALLRVSTTVRGAVWRGLLIAAIASIVTAAGVFRQVGFAYPSDGPLRGLAEVLVMAANAVGQLFLAGTPLVVLAAVLVVSYLRARSLTAPQPV
jgi:hypothetical protein